MRSSCASCRAPTWKTRSSWRKNCGRASLRFRSLITISLRAASLPSVWASRPWSLKKVRLSVSSSRLRTQRSICQRKAEETRSVWRLRKCFRETPVKNRQNEGVRLLMMRRRKMKVQTVCFGKDLFCRTFAVEIRPPLPLGVPALPGGPPHPGLRPPGVRPPGAFCAVGARGGIF